MAPKVVLDPHGGCARGVGAARGTHVVPGVEDEALVVRIGGEDGEVLVEEREDGLDGGTRVESLEDAAELDPVHDGRIAILPRVGLRVGGLQVPPDPRTKPRGWRFGVSNVDVVVYPHREEPISQSPGQQVLVEAQLGGRRA